MYSLNDITAIIVYFNGGSQVVATTKMLSNTVKNVLIVDNCSNIDNQKYLAELIGLKNVDILHNEKNKGLAYALNRGLEFARKNHTDLLLTLDQDTEISKNCIENLLRAIDIKEKIVSVGPVYGNKSSQRNDIKDVTFLITSGNLLYVPAIKNVGGYMEYLFIDGIDIDISFRLISNGYRLQKIATAYINHKIGEYEYSTIFHIPYLAHAPERYYFKYRNNIILYKKYFRKLPCLCLKLCLVLFMEFFKLIFLEKRKKEKLSYVFSGIKEGIYYNP